VRETHTTRGFPVFGIALAGLVLGHLATYALLFPDPDHRGLVLASSGHAYMTALAHAACLIAAAAAATIVSRSWGGDDHGPALSFVGLAGVLVIAQSSAFMGQEILERAVSGSPLHELFAGPVLVVGMGVQAALAMIGAVIVTWLRRTTEHIAATAPAARSPIWRPRALVPLVAVDRACLTPAFLGVRPGRSPPSV